MTANGLRLAFGTLTAIPVTAPTHIDRRVAGRAMALAPLTQLPLVVVLLLWGWAVREAPVPPLLAAALTLVAITLATRGMHLDGLADTADGLSASYDRAAALDVMRRGNIGPGGVAAVVLVLLVDAASLASLLPTWPGITLVCLGVLASRHLLAWACAVGVPSARREGLGATVAGSVQPAVVGLGFVLLLGVSALATQWSGSPWWTGPIAVAAAALGGVAVIARATRRLGGITGDVLGAVVEVSLAVALATSALLMSVTT
ncbi:MAG TPA: adenosylcobinamide-GDP ribazoletransferase [Dermatophilaceae bacterium]